MADLIYTLRLTQQEMADLREAIRHSLEEACHNDHAMVDRLELLLAIFPRLAKED